MKIKGCLRTLLRWFYLSKSLKTVYNRTVYKIIQSKL